MATVSELVVDTLAAQGVARVWGVVGDALNPLVDAIAANDAVEWYGVQHEEVAAFAAGAEAQLTGQLAVCAGTVGPGALHLVNGLVDARASRAPVLAITGQVRRAEIGTEFFQEVDLDAAFRPLTLYNHTLTVAEQAPRVLTTAINTAAGRRGPVVVTIPADLGGASVDSVDADLKLRLRPGRIVPDLVAIEDAVAVIDGSERVTILAGIGACEARGEVIALAGRLGAPVVAALRAKDFFEWDNPFYVGLTGLIGNGAAADAVREADALIMVGTDFPYREWLPDGAKIIQIDVDPAAIGRRCRVEVGIHSDAGEAVRRIAESVEVKGHGDHLESAQQSWQRWLRRQENMAEGEGIVGMAYASYVELNDGRLHPEKVAQVIGELADRDAIFTADVGLSTVWAARFVQTGSAQRLLGSFKHGSMANALPQALGAKAAHASRQVISLSGDGGLMMLLGDLRSVVTLALPVKIVVFNNESLGLVELEEAEMGMPPTGTKIDTPSFAEVGRALGVPGFTVSREEELRPTLMEALNLDGPALVDVHTSSSAISIPPSPSVSQAWGFAKSTARSLFGSRS